jgi:(p)ppGpp synthase/HD superfamily hydrolase
MLTQRFEDAVAYAVNLHAAQYRKGSRIPYVSHLFAVTSLVLEDGGDEDQAIAALLHDAAEDQGGEKTLKEIEDLFGIRVAEIVAECTDSLVTPKPSWKNRKEKYLENLKHAPLDIKRISLADKLHNARSIVMDLRKSGSQIWSRFNGGKEGTLWYYQSLAQIFKERGFDYLSSELERVLTEMVALAGKES